MSWLTQALEANLQLLNVGGSVLWSVIGVMLLLWLLLVERWLFARFASRQRIDGWHRHWQQRADHHSRFAGHIRRQRLAQLDCLLRRRLELITCLIALCPMLGLLGTVTGMIQVFDVITHHGSGDARLMAAGIAQATLPTLAGLVAALSGLVGRSYLLRAIRRRHHSLAIALETETPCA